MSDEIIPSQSDKSFEDLRRINDHGAEYWSARELQVLLGYNQWRRFEGIVIRAINLIASGESCGQIISQRSPVSIGSGATRMVVDYEIDNAAAKLIKQLTAAYKLNDHFPVRNEAALLRLLAKYCTGKRIPFVFQSKWNEFVFDALVDHQIAIEIDEPHHHEGGRTARRDERKTEFAQENGLILLRFSLEQDIVDIILAIDLVLSKTIVRRKRAAWAGKEAGYKGLYNGLGSETIKHRKGIAPSENLMDRMDTTELAANQFRMTQARDKLARERINNQQQAIRAHEQVGKEVRAAIQRIGGTMPENIKPAEHIKTVEKRVKDSIPKMELDERDAKGLIGDGGSSEQQ